MLLRSYSSYPAALINNSPDGTHVVNFMKDTAKYNVPSCIREKKGSAFISNQFVDRLLNNIQIIYTPIDHGAIGILERQ